MPGIWSAVKPAHAKIRRRERDVREFTYKPRECDICGSEYTPKGDENGAFFCPDCSGDFERAMVENYQPV